MIHQNENGDWEITSRELTIENSTHCGANCCMCPREEYDEKWSHMSTPLFIKAMDQAAELGVISLDLTGFGDSFLDPKVDEKLAYVKDKYPEIKIYTSTTAHAMQGKKFDLALKYFDTIRISNYGFSKESYEAVHGGKLKYEKVMDNIHNLLERPPGQRPYTMMSFLMLDENQGEAEAWKEYWEPRVDEIAIWRPHNYGGADSIEQYAFRSGSRDQHLNQHSCGRPFKGNPSVKVNGDLTVCCFDFNHKLIVGNLNEMSLQDILTGEKMEHIRQIHRDNSYDGCGLLCDGCDQIYDRQDALVYSSNTSRKVGQPNNHPDHIVELENDIDTL
ncbi:MAG: SPASM domain-containing protein [Magnetovibrio sp.]|nr:SPASM domain-containing protein [Magnetovibrio sp.]